jgi:hypothetical protein
MTKKKSTTFYIGLALLAIGIIILLQVLGIVIISQKWWLPVILIAVGLLVILGRKGPVGILGWIGFLYGAVLLLMAIGLFDIALLWQLSATYPLLFGLILIL